jgi:hypothetical protein
MRMFGGATRPRRKWLLGLLELGMMSRAGGFYRDLVSLTITMNTGHSREG